MSEPWSPRRYFENWNAMETGEAWETAEEFVVEPTFNAKIAATIGDDLSWGRCDGKQMANPVSVIQRVLHAMVDHYVMQRPTDEASLQSHHECTFYGPVFEGMKVRVDVRIPTKFVRRAKNYAVYEARVTDVASGRLLMQEKRTRMVSRDRSSGQPLRPGLTAVRQEKK